MPMKPDIAAINVKIAEQGYSWSAAENPITALSAEEQDTLLGYNPDPASGELSLAMREQQSEAVAAAVAAQPAAVAKMTGGIGAPSAADLRSYNGFNYITPVKNQGNCGSCVAFGSIAALEGTMRFVGRNADLALDFSEGHLFNCIARSQGRTCGGANGGWWVGPAVVALRDQGVVDEACSPYSPADIACTLCNGWQGRVTRTRGFKEFTAQAAMKDWISKSGPLIACFSVYSDFLGYRSGVYRRTSNEHRGGHCVCVVGYDDARGAWICKNSWGTGWGDQGYFLIAYGQCGIDATMWGIEVSSVPSKPTLTPLHRYWNGRIGDHFYTTNWAELGSGRSGWEYEGVQCVIAPAATPGLVPLYRYWNGPAGDHFYTTNWDELGGGRHGWAYEGVQGYVSPSPGPGLIPLHRYWNPAIADHFYTTDWNELGGGRHGWGYEGIQCYVWPNTATTWDEGVPPTFRTESTPSVPTAGTFEMAPAADPFRGPVKGGVPATFTYNTGNGVPATFKIAPEHGDESVQPCGCAKKSGGVSVVVNR